MDIYGETYSGGAIPSPASTIRYVAIWLSNDAFWRPGGVWRYTTNGCPTIFDTGATFPVRWMSCDWPMLTDSKIPECRSPWHLITTPVTFSGIHPCLCAAQSAVWHSDDYNQCRIGHSDVGFRDNQNLHSSKTFDNESNAWLRHPCYILHID